MIGKILKVFFIAAVIFVFAVPVPSSQERLTAAAAKDRFNALSASQEPKEIVITGIQQIKNNYTVYANEKIIVKDGAALYINEGTELALYGKIKVDSGGAVYVKGTLTSMGGSRISNSGKIKLISGKLDLSGKLDISEDAVLKGSGDLIVRNRFSDIVCKGSVTCGIVPPKPVTKDGVTTVGGVPIVNKRYSLPSDYGDGLDPDAYSAFGVMKKASGYDMSIVSGFRSYDYQTEVFAYWCKVDGKKKAESYSARPGHSEHQMGLAMDITSIEEDYADTDEGKWLAEHCWEYGFIIRYPKDKTDITGYVYEPWHIRYLGKSTASLVHSSGLTLEEFLGVKG